MWVAKQMGHTDWSLTAKSLFAMDYLGYAGRWQESGKDLVTTWSQQHRN